MLQKFNYSTIQSNYIKYILQNTNIPMIPFAKDMFHITAGNLYIYDGNIVLAKHDESFDVINTAIKTGNYGGINNPYDYFFSVKTPYIFGKEYPGITTKVTSNSNTYDSKTHYYLGQYLRAYKAYYGIDLFPFYNIFANEYFSGADFIYDSSKTAPYHNIDVEKIDEKYKYYSIPINFCREYTIAIDSPTPVSLIPVFIDRKGILNSLTTQLQNIITLTPETGSPTASSAHQKLLSKDNYYKKSTSFSKPFIFQSPCIVGGINRSNIDASEPSRIEAYNSQSLLLTYEKFLRLIIKVPITNNSSLVVLEGNYSNINPFSKKIISTSEKDLQINNYEEKYSNFDEYLNQNLLSNLSLLRVNDSNNYAFCDRLYEYLVNNVITKNESLEGNIARIQKYLDMPETSIWSTDIRISTYKLLNKLSDIYKEQLPFDLTGYIDKDCEKYLIDYYSKITNQKNKITETLSVTDRQREQEKLARLLSYKE